MYGFLTTELDWEYTNFLSQLFGDGSSRWIACKEQVYWITAQLRVGKVLPVYEAHGRCTYPARQIDTLQDY